MWTSRKTVIKTIGAMISANHAMTFATVSSVSLCRNEAWARDGNARKTKARNGKRRLPRSERALSVDWIITSRGSRFILTAVYVAYFGLSSAASRGGIGHCALYRAH